MSWGFMGKEGSDVEEGGRSWKKTKETRRQREFKTTEEKSKKMEQAKGQRESEAGGVKIRK